MCSPTSAIDEGGGEKGGHVGELFCFAIIAYQAIIEKWDNWPSGREIVDKNTATYPWLGRILSSGVRSMYTEWGGVFRGKTSKT
jgi:hypothetical protein